jgi:hypothetical protein
MSGRSRELSLMQLLLYVTSPIKWVWKLQDSVLEDDHSRTEVKNAWTVISNAPHSFKKKRVLKDGGKLYL